MSLFLCAVLKSDLVSFFYKINTQKSLAFLYTNNENVEKEIKEQIRQIISENNISSVADVYTLLKDSFKEILQELMEAELDATLGYEKNHKGDLQTTNIHLEL